MALFSNPISHFHCFLLQFASPRSLQRLIRNFQTELSLLSFYFAAHHLLEFEPTRSLEERLTRTDGSRRGKLRVAGGRRCLLSIFCRMRSSSAFCNGVPDDITYAGATRHSVRDERPTGRKRKRGLKRERAIGPVESIVRFVIDTRKCGT